MRAILLTLLAAALASAQGQPPTIGMLNPNGGSGAGFQFALPVSDASAASNIGFAELLFNGSLSGTSGCLIHYDQSGGVIYLGDDTQPTWVDSGAPGSTGTLRNSQCTVNLAATTVTATGVNLTLSVAASSSPSSTGLKNIYAQDGTDTLNNDCQTVG